MPARVLAAGTRLGAAASSSPASVLASHRRAAGCPLRCSAPAAPSEPAELALRVAGSRRVLCGRTAEPCRPHVPSSSAEFRAAAAVRASAFYTYPKDRSAFAASSHQRMKARRMLLTGVAAHGCPDAARELADGRRVGCHRGEDQRQGRSLQSCVGELPRGRCAAWALSL